MIYTYFRDRSVSSHLYSLEGQTVVIVYGPSGAKGTYHERYSGRTQAHYHLGRSNSCGAKGKDVERHRISQGACIWRVSPPTHSKPYRDVDGGSERGARRVRGRASRVSL